jgi:hypothetical protein
VRRSLTTVALAVLSIVLLAGCGRGQAAIPAGSQVVVVVATESEVHLEPATVRAGDVYVLLERPGSSVGFAQRMRTATETPGPLSDDDLVRLAHGDTQGTAIGGFDQVGCSPEQRAEDRGGMGYCGNVFQIVLTPGKYAFFAGNLDGMPPGDYSRSIAVLEVLP